ncbi:bifunctional 2-polyprenyl-6-hydroxyphenol methylase/3-demethylubiquinol 3-O-methyltransferase UbiG [Oceanibaculum sp.]|uniref:bifunctional 2-polyprenyl-6-hydroxyphenol methylase/3-demethylubiquinol 3-O-methyltransferase UbiG n=1 Tax=Oceanibaculum sp. TaxID=1903597 RepID=UPI0025872B55|nr:bifunctional 2-polyprenyl-6-hydroxyphenol methylase/3-demethylubiquinol 3-O-methyltransferase UbiG [Oceanibaculum sp.]MCH2394153.1 bifunctional 2-polyprenyl-6-hydroxyphenol methylase/3-demethylubiquinol 3-O-methyltransferase UbiG [Oceanibaculum sp.]
MGSTVDAREIAQFAAIADAWWDEEGAFRPLHRLNPVRLRYIRDRLCAHFGRDPEAPKPLNGLRLVDVGCGGGLLCEPMTRMGATVTGIDAAEEGIAAAKAHAASVGLKIDYRAATAESLVEAGESFDAVISMEVLEHVADVDAFLAACRDLTRPGGALALSTLNRTPKSYLTAIVGAEYVLRWLPRGTHNWKKFIRPSELAAALRRQGLELADLTGIEYSPLADRFSLGRDLGVNYLAFATRP